MFRIWCLVACAVGSKRIIKDISLVRAITVPFKISSSPFVVVRKDKLDPIFVVQTELQNVARVRPPDVH